MSLLGALDDDKEVEVGREKDSALVSFSSMDEVGLRKKTQGSSGSGSKESDKRYIVRYVTCCSTSMRSLYTAHGLH